MIRCENLGYRYDERHGIQDVSFELKGKGIHALIGRNGSGKTTLLELLCGIRVPDTGRIYINREQIDPGQEVRWKSSLGYCPSNQLFVGFLSVRENYELIGELRCGRRLAWREQAATIADFGVTELLERRANELSGGQLRRAMLLSVLIGKPELLILDEPGNDLDIEGIFLLRELLAGLAPDHYILVSTHILDVLRDLEVRALFMDNGSLVYDSAHQEGRLASASLERLYRDLVWNGRKLPDGQSNLLRKE